MFDTTVGEYHEACYFNAKEVETKVGSDRARRLSFRALIDPRYLLCFAAIMFALATGGMVAVVSVAAVAALLANILLRPRFDGHDESRGPFSAPDLGFLLWLADHRMALETGARMRSTLAFAGFATSACMMSAAAMAEEPRLLLVATTLALIALMSFRQALARIVRGDA